MPFKVFMAMFMTFSTTCFGAQTIITVAGGGANQGDGPATSVALANPAGIALDAAGNLYIADTDHHRIARVDAVTGNLTTLAGTGAAGFFDGAGATAQFNAPMDLAVDADGNVYVADSNSGRIRKIDGVTGEVTTIAGGGANKEDNIAALEYGFEFPTGVTLDGAGNLYIADPPSNVVLKMDLAAGTITRAAGDYGLGFGGDGGPALNAQFREPLRVTFDAAGNMVITDTLNHRLRRVDAATGVVTTIAGVGVDSFSGDGGPATAAELNYPSATVFDGAGNLLLLDADNYRIRQIDAAGIITTYAGTGIDGFSGDGADIARSSFIFPLDIARDAAGNLYIADTYNNRIRKIGADLTSTFDRDADAFPDHVEAAATTDPLNASSTPFSNAPLADFDEHTLGTLTIKLNFKKAGNDTIQFTGVLPVPDNVTIPGAQVIVDIGGIAVRFSLDERGNSTPKSNNSFKLSVKPRDGLSKYSLKLSKGSFAAQLGSLNLTNADVKNQFVAVPLTIYFGNKSFQKASFSFYNAKAGKSGQLKTSKDFVPGVRQSTTRPGGR